jgi:hypothetical protein
LKGVVVVYVDDMLFLGEKSHINAMVNKVKEKWETSPPEEVGDTEGVRFLGSEIWKKQRWFMECYTRKLHPRSSTTKSGGRS